MERSKRSTPPTDSPSLVFTHGKNYQDQTFCTLSNGSYHDRSVPEMRRMHCSGSSYGWLILENMFSSENYTYLFNPVSMQKIQLPPYINNNLYDSSVLTSSPIDPNCIVVLLINNKSIIFCRIADEKWTQLKLRFKKDDNIQLLSCRGKIYAFSSSFERMAVIEFLENGSSPSIELHDLELDQFGSATRIGTYKYNLLESCGDMFLVVSQHFGESMNIIENLSVYRLDLCRMHWIKVESICNRIFLLGRNSMSISASDIGATKGDCIYYYVCNVTCLFKFDMGKGTTKITLPCLRKFPHWKEPYWVVPDCKLQIVRPTICLEKDTSLRHLQDWDCLPNELWEHISPFLFLRDCIRFRLACKSWKSITPPLRSINLLQSEPGTCNLPWLVCLPKEDEGVCNLCHPMYGDTFTMEIPELTGATIQCAKYGWLLMSKGKKSLFFFNPLTTEIIKLPDSELDFHLMAGFSFSAHPTSTDFVVLAYNLCETFVYRKTKERWSIYFTSQFLPLEFVSFFGNPVFCDGLFYCLSMDGKLAVFDSMAVTKESQWRIIREPAFFSIAKHSKLDKFNRKSFMVEDDGEILAVSVDILGKPIRVFKLDKSKEKWLWSELKELGDNVLFLSQTATVLLPLPADCKGVENRIYFPRFYEKESIFYSLSDGNYCCFGGEFSRPDWIDTFEHNNCAWVQLNRE